MTKDSRDFNEDTPSEFKISLGGGKGIKIGSISSSMPLILTVLVVAILYGGYVLVDRFIGTTESYASMYYKEVSKQHDDMLKEQKITNELLRVLVQASK